MGGLGFGMLGCSGSRGGAQESKEHPTHDCIFIEVLCPLPPCNRPLFALLPTPHRPDAKNGLYQQTIKRGDAVLSRMQNLSKIIDVD